MANGNEDHSGSLSASGRFARMEGALERIEEKLDKKADANDMVSLNVRVNRLEIIDSNRVAVAQTVKDTAEIMATVVQRTANARYRTLMTIVGVLTLVNLAIGVGRFLF